MQDLLDNEYEGENIQFIGVSTGDPEYYLEAFKEETGSEFPWVMLNHLVPNRYNRDLFERYELAEDIQTLILIDKDGIIRYRDYGSQLVEKDLDYQTAFDMIGDLIEEAQTPIGYDVGERAIAFSLEDLDGNTVSLTDFYGKVVVLTFWDWGCIECREWSLPKLQEAQELLGEGLVVIAVNITPEPNLERLKDYREERGITYPMLLKGMETAFSYNVYTIPILFIMDQKHVIQLREHEAWKDEYLGMLQNLISTAE